MGCGNAKLKEFFGVYQDGELGESKILRSTNIGITDPLVEKAPNHDSETLIDILE